MRDQSRETKQESSSLLDFSVGLWEAQQINWSFGEEARKQVTTRKLG
jgi:hypothetical protein